jgi:hypothetical protein
LTYRVAPCESWSRASEVGQHLDQRHRHHALLTGGFEESPTLDWSGLSIVTNAVIDHLCASGYFSLVSTYDGRPDKDYIFSGKLEKLEEVDYQAGVKVEVAISAQITRVATGATVWSNTVSEVGTVSQRTVPGVVSQMNRTLDIAISKLLSTVPAPLASNKH